jgi:hypothetical protein
VPSEMPETLPARIPAATQTILPVSLLDPSLANH